MTKNWKYALLIAGLFSFSSAIGQTMQDGRRLLEMERYGEAKKTLSKVVKNQNNELNNIALGDAYLRAGQPDSAVMYYNIAAGMNKKSALGMAAAGKAALVKNNVAEADKQFADAVKRSKSKDSNVLMVIGSAYFDTKKDYNKAVEYLTKAVKANNKNAPAYVMLGDAQLELKRGGEAMTAYENAISADSKYALAHLRKGQLSVRSRNYNEAQNSYQAVINMDPNYAPAYRDLGELYYFAGKYDLALENYKKYVAMAENTPETRAVYASFLYLTKDYAGTIKEAEEVLKRDPNNVVMKRLLAYSYYETKQDDKALAAIQDYFKTTPADKLLATDYEYQGKILARADKSDEALNSFNKALSMDSTRADLRNDIAQIYVKQNNFPKAIALYRDKMNRSKPTNTDYYYLGNLYDQAKNYKAADSLYALITTNNPTYAQAYLWRARSNANLDPESKTGLAKPHYEKYIELASAEKDKNKSGLVEANYYLAYYNYLKKDKAQANMHLKEVLTLEPGNVQAKTLSDVVNGKVKAKTKTKK
ncbi:tetratricopeptide repeat protein [Adhaeribacter terreus]|uniref:Tetratricopeptide repeat protein n=1 Tax=Adhaeribacter terreus TaxID=529703 RepID=A0ABW0EBJ9_9BACT